MTESRAGLAATSWPRFRSNATASGRSAYAGPQGNGVVWRHEAGPSVAEPAVGPDGTIYLPLASDELVAIHPKDGELWRGSLPWQSASDKLLSGMTTPAVRGDGSLIVMALAKIACLNLDGSLRWERFIDGLPTAANVGPQGTVYVSAWSFDWVGFYLISPDGKAVGEDDPRLTPHWSPGPGSQVPPVALDERGHVAVAYRAYQTYTWEPEGEPEMEHDFACAAFDAQGHLIGRVKHTGIGRWKATALSVGDNGLVYHVGGGYGEMTVFAPHEITLERPAHNQKIRWQYNRFDRPSLPVERNLYGWEIVGYPTHGLNDTVWVRLGLQEETEEHAPIAPSALILGLAASTGEVREMFRLPAPVAADPVIDRDGQIYVGTQGGAVHLFDPSGVEQLVIDVGSPVSSLAIGADASLVVACEDGGVRWVR